MIWEDAELLQLRQFDSFMESAPQLLLKLYIALKGGSHFGVLSAIFKIFTVVSLAWTLVSYDQKICLMDGVKKSGNSNQRNPSNGITIDYNNDAAINCIKDVNWTNSAILCLANFLWIVGRLMALSLFASAYGWIIWPVCIAHLIPIFVWHLETNYNFMDSLRLSFLHLFAYLYPTKKAGEKEPDAHPRFSPAMYQSVCLCENVILMILWMESFSKGDDWDIIRIYWIIQFATTLASFALFWWVKEINKMLRERDFSPTQTEDQSTPETVLTLSP
ncbi:hypothetical protein DAPPUDRAFT_323093 [Daphnia pulex]|uniref:XK-related protein n=1 Tax=Daphnia pulex TaxID=6669 RepID=E9GXW2_DAPPU|nr:hypothetical protein DAPPUDRAFT_302666 [Daphnia pulex]EFX75728.1 hypothetical protein DAPPUDRAFT_323093 [Daphnia pulex]|eukprot:EFX66524.1 hypothetical protein DAPPUDRAFT_302666 [Daphnia pulex]